MEAFGVRFLVAPQSSLAALSFIFAGIVLGTVSGLTPGIHVNNLALLVAASISLIPGPPHLVGTTLLAAAVVHSFLDVIPALALGVPDPAMAVTALPGHTLVLEGRGREALRLSAVGSAGALVLAVPLAIPLTRGMELAYPTVRAHLPLLFSVLGLFLLWGEADTVARLGGILSLGLSGLLGVLVLDLPVAGLLPSGDVLAPLFAGLFGAPVLLDALGGNGVPPQDDSRIALSPEAVGVASGAGTLAGAIVGYVPGVSSAIGATVALASLPGDLGDRGFIVASSGVNTANTIFALFALIALGTPRTGVLVAFDEAALPLAVPLLVLAVCVAGCVGAALVLTVGDRYLSVVGSLDNDRLALGVLGLLVVLSGVFAGFTGIGVFGVSALLGLLPTRFGARRVHLMGVLMVPIALA